MPLRVRRSPEACRRLRGKRTSNDSAGESLVWLPRRLHRTGRGLSAGSFREGGRVLLLPGTAGDGGRHLCSCTAHCEGEQMYTIHWEGCQARIRLDLRKESIGLMGGYRVAS